MDYWQVAEVQRTSTSASGIPLLDNPSNLSILAVRLALQLYTFVIAFIVPEKEQSQFPLQITNHLVTLALYQAVLQLKCF